jgi:hypothetical protein
MSTIITARIAVTLLRGQNNREHHRVRAKRVAAEREAAIEALEYAEWLTNEDLAAELLDAPGTGARVTLVRPYQVTPLDSDNLSASFKAVRDAVAEHLGIDDASARLHWVYKQVPAVVIGKSTKPGKSRASPDRDTRPTVTIEVMPVADIDPQAQALAQAEAREWALGVQVVAQAARLKLAGECIEALRLFDHARTDAALAAWDAVPGDVGPVDLG